MVKKKKNNKIKKSSKGQLGKKKETAREKMIGQTIGYRYDVNLLPDYKRLTPFLKKYIEAMGWDCLLYTSPSPRDGLLSRMPSSA